MKTKYPYLDTEKRINMLRQENNITLETLAQKLDFSKVQTSNIMNGKQRYSLETAKKIADIFQVDYRYFTYDWSEKNIKEVMKNFHDTIKKREHIITLLLESYNYKMIGIKCYKYNEYYFSQNALNELMEKTQDDSISIYASPVYQVETPNHEKKYIIMHDLEQLTNDFILLFNSRLIDRKKIAIFTQIPE